MRLRPMRLRRSARLRRVGLSRCAAQARAGGLSDIASGARLRLLGVVVWELRCRAQERKRRGAVRARLGVYMRRTHRVFV